VETLAAWRDGQGEREEGSSAVLARAASALAASNMAMRDVALPPLPTPPPRPPARERAPRGLGLSYLAVDILGRSSGAPDAASISGDVAGRLSLETRTRHTTYEALRVLPPLLSLSLSLLSLSFSLFLSLSLSLSLFLALSPRLSPSLSLPRKTAG